MQSFETGRIYRVLRRDKALGGRSEYTVDLNSEKNCFDVDALTFLETSVK